MNRLRLLLVANILTHYRLPLYEELQNQIALELIFFSDGQEWYWQRTEEPSGDSLVNARWLKGWWIGRTRIVPGLPVAVWRSQADVIIKDQAGKFALPMTYLAARLRRKPFILWAGLSEHPSNGVHRFTRPLMRFFYRRSDAIVTYGHHVSRHVIAEGAQPDRVLIARQAVRPFAGAPPHEGRWQQPLQLLYVGRLETWKGIHLLLDALARLGTANWHLRIAGRGSQEGALRAQARDLAIDNRIRFLGHVPNHSLPALYESSAILMVPSIRTASITEPWALVVNEAMQAGVLVVSSDCVGAVQDGLVRHGHSGVVFEAGNVDSLAQRLAFVTDKGNCAQMRRIAAVAQGEVAKYSFSEAVRSFIAAGTMAQAARMDVRTGRRP